MTTPEYSDDLDRPRSSSPRSALKIAATAATAVVLAIGAYAIGKSNTSTTTASTATGGTSATQSSAGTTQAPPTATDGGGQADPRGGYGGPPGMMGTEVTGATLTKLTQVATAKYPGTVERAFKQSDGSYQVHVIKADGSGEVHVLVSKAFKITGTETGGPGGPPLGRSQGGTQVPPTTGTGSSS